ncbi:MAG: beta-lactamase family protein [Oscillospiraceae bacterium]|jgi:CubicO group peptidase (beta-lactamase class C family)|nr:beta-lactamase family protein [Oscillospiraceae bacterium]
MLEISTFSFIQTLLDDGVRGGAFPSAVASVGYRDEPPLLFASGGADIATRFDMASCTKAFAATPLSLLAIEDGDLTLFDTISRFFPDAPPDKSGITILRLLTHTSGFTPHYHIQDDTDDPARVIESILRSPLLDQPEGTPAYSCIGFILLGKILEKIYGAGLDELSDARVFKPLGMRNTSYNPTGVNIAPTETDAETGTAWRGIVHDENARFLGGVSANAGIFSDIADTSRYCAMLANDGEGFLAEATLRKATRNYTPGHDTHRGLGFHLAGSPLNYMGDLFPPESFGHTGFTGTCFAVDPYTGFYATLLTNRVHPTRANEKILRFRRVFHNRIYAAFSRVSNQTKGLRC